MTELCEGCSIGFFESIRFNRSDILQFFFQHEILHQMTLCPNCKAPIVLDINSLSFRCPRRVSLNKKAKKKCSFKKSARVGSLIGGTNVPLEKVFYLISVFLHFSPPRHPLLAREIQISAQSIVEWNRCCQGVCYDHVSATSGKLGGPLKIVEVGESKFGGSASRGNRTEEHWIIGGIERDSGNIFVVPIETRDSKTLLNIIKEHVLPHTTVLSNCWRSYNCSSEEGFTELTSDKYIKLEDPEFGANESKIKLEDPEFGANESKIKFEDPDFGNGTHSVHCMLRDLRKIVPKAGIRKENYNYYIAEFLFKRKYKDYNERLHIFFKAASKLFPPTY